MDHTRDNKERLRNVIEMLEMWICLQADGKNKAMDIISSKNVLIV